MGTSTIPAGGGGGLQPKYQKFTSSGTFTLPDGYGAAKPLLITIQVIGGGGGGSPDSFNATAPVATVTHQGYFGDAQIKTMNALALSANNTNGSGGGSGGIAATQMYLTGNLTITCGAAGARPSTATLTATNQRISNSETWTAGASRNYNMGISGQTPGGTGGTSTAGAVSATGGTGANFNAVNVTVTWNSSQSTVQTGTTNTSTTANFTSGPAGQPAGSVGDAVPLLGALAGGSGNATPVYGAFGVGGKRGDTTTHTGVEGTGGGVGSIGASGAVIITWWQ